jgi:hypothetical protein
MRQPIMGLRPKVGLLQKRSDVGAHPVSEGTCIVTTVRLKILINQRDGCLAWVDIRTPVYTNVRSLHGAIFISRKNRDCYR